MINILFTCNWGQTDRQLLERLTKQTPGNKGEWGPLKGVTELKDANWVVVIGDVREDLRRQLDPEGTIYFSREAPCNRTEIYDSIEAYYKFDYRTQWCCGLWWVEKPFDELVAARYPKSKKLSCITTAKNHLPGHRARYQFLRMFHQAAGGSMDLFGIDSNELTRDFGLDYRGPLPYNGPSGRNGDKSPGLLDYEYAFCFENCQLENYFTEKILDAYLCWAMPIYWGCPNLADFFPLDSFYTLDLSHMEASVKFSAELIQRPLENRHIEAMVNARTKVLYKYNIWQMVYDVLNEGKLSW